MARRAEEAENHWPGFVDALSTIVMVVTFLLIILGIVIFVISKNISTELAASAQKVEEAQKALDKALAKAESAQAQAQQAKAAGREQKLAQGEADSKAQKQEKSKDKGQSEAKKNGSDATDVYRADLARELTQNVKYDGKNKHAVRSRKPRDSKEIVIARTEKQIDPRKVRVSSSTAILSLKFNGGIKITEEAASKVQSYLATNIADMSRNFEIRAFYGAHKGAISEGRRMAYYRALATRNELLGLGVVPGNISLKVAHSSHKEDASKVSIYLK